MTQISLGAIDSRKSATDQRIATFCDDKPHVIGKDHALDIVVLDISRLQRGVDGALSAHDALFELAKRGDILRGCGPERRFWSRAGLHSNYRRSHRAKFNSNNA